MDPSTGGSVDRAAVVGDSELVGAVPVGRLGVVELCSVEVPGDGADGVLGAVLGSEFEQPANVSAIAMTTKGR